MAKKVGDLGAEQTEEKQKGRQEYDSTALVAENAEAVNAEGLFTIAPSDYNYRKNKPLRKEQFASEPVYLLYQSLIASQKAEFYAQKSAELVGKAERLKKFGSEAARKTAGKLAKAKAQMVILRQQLLDTDMTEEELDALIENM